MENNLKEAQIIVGGAAGEGSKKAGLLIGKLFNAYGFRVFIHEDYESVIKGGHNFSQISVSREKKEAIEEKIDFLLALNKGAVLKHKEKVKEGGVIIYDKDVDCEDVNVVEGVDMVEVPLKEIVERAEGIPLMKNTALVSAFCKIMGMSFDKVGFVLGKELPVETEKNLEVARIAYEEMESKREIKETGNEPLPLFSGNEVVGLGAIYAGLECYYAYPMTPSTGVLMFLSKIEGVKTFQPESEIGVINAALGSAYAGRRTMIGTSGGGFALMTEGISFSAQSEIPLVTVLSQRMGPATGVPTYQAQGDLLFALNSGHGDMMRFVVAPGDVSETYELSGKAMNIAWKYQLPSIILLDKELAENTYTLDRELDVLKEDCVMADDSHDYKRYAGEDISPMLFPGGEAVVKTTGYEHNEKGVAVEDAQSIKEMHDKRMRKYEKLKKEVEEMDSVRVEGEGDVCIVFWGSTKGAAKEATKEMNVKLVQPLVFQPLPEEKLKKEILGSKKIISVETNATGQMTSVLKSAGIEVHETILKYDGRPFTVEELKREIEKRI